MTESEQYKLLVQHIEIKSVSLLNQNVRRYGVPFVAFSARSRRVNTDTHFAMRATDEQGHFLANASLDLRATAIVDGKRRVLARIALEYELGYVVSKEVMERFTATLKDNNGALGNIFQRFADMNVRVNVWPYMRAEVAHISTALDIPVITLQVMRRG